MRTRLFLEFPSNAKQRRKQAFGFYGRLLAQRFMVDTTPDNEAARPELLEGPVVRQAHHERWLFTLTTAKVQMQIDNRKESNVELTGTGRLHPSAPRFRRERGSTATLRLCCKRVGHLASLNLDDTTLTKPGEQCGKLLLGQLLFKQRVECAQQSLLCSWLRCFATN